MRQVCVTVVYGEHAGRLDWTFASFARNRFLELHAFVLGDGLPDRQVPGITYHLRAPDPSWSHPMRDADFRRWQLIDELDASHALVVDGCDVLCLQSLPEIPDLLKGGWVAGVCEHPGGRYVEGLYIGSFLNAGVTWWDVRASKPLRDAIIARGRVRFRNCEDDQLCLNEVITSRYLDRLTLLPFIYNHRAYLGHRVRGWPTTDTLDGVRIYHNDDSGKVRDLRFAAGLPAPRELAADAGPLDGRAQSWRRLRERMKPQTITGSFWEAVRARLFR